MHVWPLYGLATIAAITLAAHGRGMRGSGGTLGAACLLGVLWVIWNCSHWLVSPNYNRFFPFLDAATVMILAWIWRRSMSQWKASLIGLFLLSCAVHVGYFYLGDHSRTAKYAYDLKQNLIYIGELACVSVYGAARIWRGLVK